MERRYEVLVIGGGQAGLAMGHYLARADRDFATLDAATRIGQSWRTRWDSLKLFTPARYSSLPGLPFPGDPEHYPGRDAVADYLEQYAERFDLPVHPGVRVHALRQLPEGGFAIESNMGAYTADQVVVATGPFQNPWSPSVGNDLAAEIVQLQSSEYRNPDALPPGEVLVVGGGNSGVQIAAELALTRPTTLAVGERLTRLPQRLLGESVFWWLERSGAMQVTIDSRLGRKASAREVLIGESPERVARTLGVRLVGRVVTAGGDTVGTAAGERLRPAAVVWATGFRSDFGWIDTPVLDDRGRPRQRRGVTAAPGLYFLGLPWQHTRGSALIGWVGRDAEFLAGRIASRTPWRSGGKIDLAPTG